MDHLECAKKWPAAYAIMAAIMDDVSIDRDAAVTKWGTLMVAAAEDYGSAAISEDIIVYVMKCLLDHFGIDAAIKRPTGSATESATDIPVKSTSATLSPTGPPRRAYAPKGSKAKSVLRGTIIRTYTVAKEARFGGGERHVMEVRPNGAIRAVSGTIPTAMIGKVGAGDVVELEAQVWSFDDKDGWFKYPANMKVVTKA